MSAPAEQVAPLLLGRVLRVDSPDGPVEVRLTEVEAYAGVGEDPGSHAHRGRTSRNATMFGPPGRLYVYLSYGVHYCANVVTGPAGRASAVLLRAGEVVLGADLATRRARGTSGPGTARGPGRLTRALGLDLTHDGVDLLDPASPVRLLPAAAPIGAVRTGPRTGVSGPGAVTPWRFALVDDPSVSPYRPARPRRTTNASPPAS